MLNVLQHTPLTNFCGCLYDIYDMRMYDLAFSRLFLDIFIWHWCECLTAAAKYILISIIKWSYKRPVREKIVETKRYSKRRKNFAVPLFKCPLSVRSISSVTWASVSIGKIAIVSKHNACLHGSRLLRLCRLVVFLYVYTNAPLGNARFLSTI